MTRCYYATYLVRTQDTGISAERIMVGLVVLLVVVCGGLMLAWKLIEGLASVAGHIWRAVDPQERARHARVQEFRRTFPRSTDSWSEWDD